MDSLYQIRSKMLHSESNHFGGKKMKRGGLAGIWTPQILSSVRNSQKMQIFVLESKYTKNAKITFYFDQKWTQITNKLGPCIMQIHLNSAKFN